MLGVQQRSRSIAGYFSSRAELPLAEKGRVVSALLSCHVNELILPCGYWYQNIKFSKNGVIFLWLKNIALGFRMQENTFLQLRNFKIYWGSMPPDPPRGEGNGGPSQ